jgi:hypothetical protein
MSKVLTQLHSLFQTITAYHNFVASIKMGHQYCGTSDNRQGNCKYAVVIVKYFMKWIEEPLVNIAAAGFKRFFWQNVICHFGVL